jgi:DNA-binding MarR family transcriptional regulator
MSPARMTVVSTSRREQAERIWDAMRLIVLDNTRNADLTERFGLGPGGGKLRTLLVLKDGPLSLRQIAGARGVEPPYVTVIVDRLEELGLVERTTDPEDRRRKLVSLTDSGKVAVRIATEAAAAPPAALGHLSPEEMDQLDGLLAKLRPEGDRMLPSAKPG